MKNHFYYKYKKEQYICFCNEIIDLDIITFNPSWITGYKHGLKSIEKVHQRTLYNNINIEWHTKII